MSRIFPWRVKLLLTSLESEVLLPPFCSAAGIGYRVICLGSDLPLGKWPPSGVQRRFLADVRM